MRFMLFINFFVFFLLSMPLAATTENMGDFESLLDDVSDIATKKSLNIDYLPSVVSIIDAQTYTDAGIQNIGEALDMLPGVQLHLSPMGYTMTTVRGFKNPNAYLSDKIKILVDGVAINNEISGSSSFYMDFPIQLVDKIEVLRGPSSTVYGAGAFYATINIITKLGKSHQQNQLYLGAGSYSYRSIGANLNTSADAWKIFADGYYQRNNKSLYIPERDGSTDEAMQNVSVGFKASYENFEFLTRLKKSTYGNFYSFEGKLDPIPQTDQDHTNTYFFAQLSYTSFLDDYTLETKANFSHRELDVGADIYSVGSAANKFATVDIDMQEGFIYHENSQEQNIEAEAILTLPSMHSNDMLVAVGARQTNVIHDEFYNSVENTIMMNWDTIVNHPNYDDFRYRAEEESAFWANPTRTLLKKDVDRTILYSFFQDLISINDNIDLILGLRADNYSDFGTKLSKRAGIVYRATDETIFKLLYGSAFRAPTLIEAYQNGHINFRAGDENILPEETNTYEAEAIYSPNFNHKFTLNLFYSKLRNVIDLEEFPNTDPGYQNFKNRVSKGLEFEYYFRTKTAHNFYFNATLLDTDYTIPPEEGEIPLDQSMPDISKVMFKGIYIYRPDNRLSFGTTWRYFSQTTATELQWVKEDEIDATAHAQHIFDETITYKLSASSQLQLTVKNLFNEDIRHPSYYYYTADGGIRREGRHGFVSFTQQF